LPPELDVPLPLGFDRVDVPVVGVSARGVAELAAGSPVTAPEKILEPGGTIPNDRDCITWAEQSRFHFPAPSRWRLISNLADALF
jgi:hypothetical protein